MRRLYCKACGSSRRPGTRQTYDGSLGGPAEYARVIAGKARVPLPSHRMITIISEEGVETHPLALTHYNCDSCNARISPGDDAVAVTAWLGSPAAEPLPWEGAFIDAA